MSPEQDAPSDASPATPAPRRRSIRGYVQSYDQGRTCSVADCDTTLSRYNKATVCWRHDDPRAQS